MKEYQLECEELWAKVRLDKGESEEQNASGCQCLSQQKAVEYMASLRSDAQDHKIRGRAGGIILSIGKRNK